MPLPFNGPAPPIYPWEVPHAPGGGMVQGAPLAAPTIRYVRKSGSDSNGGTSPSDAWLTINKALTTVGSNTWVYVGAGTYREVVSVTITSTAEVKIIGDVDGFATGDVGMVQWTAYTTNDKTAPSATTLLNLNGKSFLTFQNLYLVGGNATVVTATTATSQYVNWLNCAFSAGFTGAVGSCISALCAYGMPLNWTFDRCQWLWGSANPLLFTLTGSASGGRDYDANVLIQNSSLVGVGGGNNLIRVVSSGTTTWKGGGVRAKNCLIFGSGIGMAVADAGISVQIPCTISDSIVWTSGNTGLFATTTGQLVEDYNLILTGAPRSNVNIGGHSISDGSYAPLFHFGQERVWGGTLRPFGEPMKSSPLNAFGSDGTQTSYDLRGGPRPTLATRQAIGAFQRGNNAAKETVTTNDGSVAVSFTGDGFQDYDVAVDAGPLTISAFCDYDSSYAGPLPRLMVAANLELGVGQTEVPFATTSLNAFAQASITINPTGSGIVTVRLISGDTSGVSKTAFDTLAFA